MKNILKAIEQISNWLDKKTDEEIKEFILECTIIDRSINEKFIEEYLKTAKVSRKIEKSHNKILDLTINIGDKIYIDSFAIYSLFGETPEKFVDFLKCFKFLEFFSEGEINE